MVVDLLRTQEASRQRRARVAEIGEAVANGTYQTDDKIDYTVSRLVKVLERSPRVGDKVEIEVRDGMKLDSLFSQFSETRGTRVRAEADRFFLHLPDASVGSVLVSEPPLAPALIKVRGGRALRISKFLMGSWLRAELIAIE